MVVPLFHKHKWEEVSRKFTPPIDRAVKADWVSEDMMLRWTSGFTVIELRCSVCGDLKHKDVYGEV